MFRVMAQVGIIPQNLGWHRLALAKSLLNKSSVRLRSTKCPARLSDAAPVQQDIYPITDEFGCQIICGMKLRIRNTNKNVDVRLRRGNTNGLRTRNAYVLDFDTILFK